MSGSDTEFFSHRKDIEEGTKALAAAREFASQMMEKVRAAAPGGAKSGTIESVEPDELIEIMEAIPPKGESAESMVDLVPHLSAAEATLDVIAKSSFVDTAEMIVEMNRDMASAEARLELASNPASVETAESIVALASDAGAVASAEASVAMASALVQTLHMEFIEAPTKPPR